MESWSKTHQRSISLPSRLNPSSVTKIRTELNKLKTLEISSSLSIQSGLVCLAELYLSVEELISSPQTRQACLLYRDAVLVEDALEESVGLLDSCSSLKDLFSSMKENVQNIQSVLRRKGGDSTIQSHVSAYSCFKKKAKKTIASNIGLLKQLESKIRSSVQLDVDGHLSMIISVLREVVAITISIFRSLLLFLSMKTKPSNRFSLISRLVSKTRATCDRDDESVTEVEMADLALQSLQRNIRNNETKSYDVQMAMERLQSLDARIEGFEAGLDCLFRRLIQSRASLLNILAN